MHLILVLIAVVLFIWGVTRLAARDWVAGGILIAAAFLVGPGGISIW